MIAQVIVDISNSEVDRVFDYTIPQNITVTKGNKVTVPFGNRTISGFVLGVAESSQVEEGKLKPILKVSNQLSILPELVDLCLFLKQEFYLKLIDCMKLCLPSAVRNEQVKHLTVSHISLNPNEEVVKQFLTTVRANATKQLQAIQFLSSTASDTQVNLNKRFGSAVVHKLLEAQVFQSSTEVLKRNALEHLTLTNPSQVTLTPHQQTAVKAITAAGAKTFLLHGVTGSGKTEVYLRSIEHALNLGKTAIMLVPEISLTPQTVKRFRERFGNQVAVLHSGLSDGEKHDQWHELFNGNAKVVVGARSAIFAPLTNVGVIIIDEEHDNSYISDSNPRYNTADVAVFRSKANNCPLVLGSATPNIDSYYQTQIGQYELLTLPTRVNSFPMPGVQIVDMLPEFRSGNTTPFSSVLLEELSSTVKQNQQAILFINRRGFSSFLMCRDCGHVPNCEHCDVSLVYHKQDNELKCHYCGKRYKVLTKCPQCQSKNMKLGGVGTERVVAELKQLFPSVPIFRMDNDTTTTKNAHHKILQEFESKTPSILVGTQMIAKGHDFPLVTLVGILDADLSLYFGGYRASEKTYQLITQVSGRAGRSNLPGKVVLQTYYPKHYVYKLAANYDYERFYQKEINLREVTVFPPYSTLLRILVTSENDEKAKQATHQLFLKLKELKPVWGNQLLFLEAMRSPVGKIKNKFRYQVVTRFAKNPQILEQIYQICDTMKQKDTTIFVELNPQSFS